MSRTTTTARATSRRSTPGRTAAPAAVPPQTSTPELREAVFAVIDKEAEAHAEAFDDQDELPANCTWWTALYAMLAGFASLRVPQSLAACHAPAEKLARGFIKHVLEYGTKYRRIDPGKEFPWESREQIQSIVAGLRSATYVKTLPIEPVEVLLEQEVSDRQILEMYRAAGYKLTPQLLSIEKARLARNKARQELRQGDLEASTLDLNAIRIRQADQAESIVEAPQSLAETIDCLSSLYLDPVADEESAEQLADGAPLRSLSIFTK